MPSVWSMTEAIMSEANEVRKVIMRVQEMRSGTTLKGVFFFTLSEMRNPRII